MLTLRPATERGLSKLDWLDSRHSFSFGDYQDPQHMGFSKLRVINEDRVAPGTGFGTHGHRDMEILSYVLDGELAHQDSTGVGSVIRPGDLQRMSAGTGVTHSERNPSNENPVHFLQIWIYPDTQGLPPGYEQKHFEVAQQPGQWQLIGSRDGREGSVTIHQDVNLYAATLKTNSPLTYDLLPNRSVWLQVARGSVQLNGQANDQSPDQRLSAGDGVAIASVDRLSLTADIDDSEVLLFDLPG
jgi:quercetin 2,3-dioxygenase